MSEMKEISTLPDKKKILAAYTKLFNEERAKVSRFARSGLRYVKLAGGAILVEQNPNKESNWAHLARVGHQIAWVIRDGNYLARVFDGELEILNRR